jgi:hypothetical protein
MQYKTTNKLFKGIYQYKVVLVVPGSSFFRDGDFIAAQKSLKSISLGTMSGGSIAKRYHIKSLEDLEYSIKLSSILKKLTDNSIRVESPFVSIYTNSKKDVDTLTSIDETRVKYISIPPENNSLVSGTIFLPKVNYDYRVTLAKTNHEHTTFIGWAETNKKVKLTKSCVRDLQKPRSWGGTYFYVTGDSVLLMVKMHLGSAINKVERIVKA